MRFVGQVVATGHRDARRAQTELARQRGDTVRRGPGIGGAEIADDDDAVAQAIGQHRAQFEFEQGLEAALGVGAARQLRGGQGAFGEHLEDQRRGAAAFDQRTHHQCRRVGAVAREAGSAADGVAVHRAHLLGFSG